MELEYIIAICAGSVFLLLFLIYLILAHKRRKNGIELRKHLDRAYTPKNLKKMDYDLAYYDEETAKRILDSKIAEEAQVTIDDILAPFGKTENPSDGDDNDEDDSEELIGHYKPH